MTALPAVTRAQMPPAGEIIPATATYIMAFPTHHLARKEIGYVRPNSDNLAHELMSNHHRYRNRARGPSIPVQNVNVGAADGSAFHPHQNVVDSDLRHGNIFQPQPGFGPALHQRLHEF